MTNSKAEGLPQQAGKVSGAALHKVKRWRWVHEDTMPDETTLLDFQFGKYRFDFLWRPKKNAARLFVIFSGDAMRKQNNPPVFQRWSWAEHFPGNCIFVSDPALYLNEKIGLGWYSGDKNCDFLKVISVLVDEVVSRLGISSSNVYSYGSSGGGFAAIRLAHFLPKLKAVAVNPQTQICQFEYPSVDRYLSLCFGIKSRAEAERLYSERFNLCTQANFFRDRKIFYVQNELDTHHLEVHYKAFCDALCIPAEHDIGHPTFKRYHFSHPDGHRKAETREVFVELMRQIEKGEF